MSTEPDAVPPRISLSSHPVTVQHVGPGGEVETVTALAVGPADATLSAGPFVQQTGTMYRGPVGP